MIIKGNFKKLRIYKELFELVDDDDNKDYLKFNGDQNILNDEYLEYYVNHLNKRNLHVEELKSLLNDLLIKDIDDRVDKSLLNIYIENLLKSLKSYELNDELLGFFLRFYEKYNKADNIQNHIINVIVNYIDIVEVNLKLSKKLINLIKANGNDKRLLALLITLLKIKISNNSIDEFDENDSKDLLDFSWNLVNNDDFDLFELYLEISTLLYTSIYLKVNEVPNNINLLNHLDFILNSFSNSSTLSLTFSSLSFLSLHIPQLSQNILSSARKFISNPSANDSTVSTSLSNCLHSCLINSTDLDLNSNLIHSLFNFVNPNNSSNDLILNVISKLTLKLNDTHISNLTLSFLLQKLQLNDNKINNKILSILPSLSSTSDHIIFNDVLKSLSHLSFTSSSSTKSSETSSNVLAAFNQLATITNDINLLEILLTHLLTLFSDLSLQIQSLLSNQSLVTYQISILATLLEPINTTLLKYSSLSDDLVTKFKNFWFLSTLLNLLPNQSNDAIPPSQLKYLQSIAINCPQSVFDSIYNMLDDDIEYNAIFRDDLPLNHINSQRNTLTSIISKHSYQIRYFSLPQVTFLLTFFNIERLRCLQNLPSSLLSYFTNENINNSPFSECMVSLAESIINSYIYLKSNEISIDNDLIHQINLILIGTCHKFNRVRSISFNLVDKIFIAFPTLISNLNVISTILELITLLRHSCEEELTNENSFKCNFSSKRSRFELELPFDYRLRNDMLSKFCSFADKWIQSALINSTYELQSSLKKYVDNSDLVTTTSTEMGASFALNYLTNSSPLDSHFNSLPSYGNWRLDFTSHLTNDYTLRCKTSGEITGVRLALKKGVNEMHKVPDNDIAKDDVKRLKSQTQELLSGIQNKECDLTLSDLQRLLWRCAGILVASNKPDFELLNYLVSVPCRIFTSESIKCGSQVWNWLYFERPDLQVKLIMKLCSEWEVSIFNKKGLFSPNFITEDTFNKEIEYSPSDEKLSDILISMAKRNFEPHLLLIKFFDGLLMSINSSHQSLILVLIKLIYNTNQLHSQMSNHTLSRQVRFSLIKLGFKVLNLTDIDSLIDNTFRYSLYQTSFTWFNVIPQLNVGNDKVEIESDIILLQSIISLVKNDKINNSSNKKFNYDEQLIEFKNKSGLLTLLLENEISRLSVWKNVLGEPSKGNDLISLSERNMNESLWLTYIHLSWKISPKLAIGLINRFKSTMIEKEVKKLLKLRPFDAIDIPEAIDLLIGDKLNKDSKHCLNLLSYWAPTKPSTALMFFHPKYENNQYLLQYAMKTLEYHPVNLTFFYIPQIVQALRYDKYGYIEKFIFETAKVSQLFCHQIIWNMKANTYKDDNGEEPDSLKPTLERMIDHIVFSLSGEAKSFYEREFSFFDSITSISGKLKPYVKKTKPEKKAKIDEEMNKIEVDPGVYLPSNPDGVVVDIDKKAGRPLQSHAKAPFMATFKVRKEKINIEKEDDKISSENKEEKKVEYVDKWQAAIFKVGDDCRQDMLALQSIAIFKTIFSNIGLKLYLNPYRVTATGPGCGVIDVVPNATSRDEMGRAKVNDLAEYFLQTFGNYESISYQKARYNFIKSMAAYSLICYILQVKDRHNGNIMIDGDGHIVHIDFGFLFDIGPGGIKFEPNSFKLSHEMVTVMGGKDSDGYKTFQELIVKGFLECRKYADEIVNTVHLMIGTDLPSFKGEGTMTRLRDRFMLHLTDRQATQYMLSVIRNAHENSRSIAYDEFQRITNDIPYAF